MSWNHRVIRDRTYLYNDKPCSVSDKVYCYQIYEVHYDNQGNIETTTERPMTPIGETKEELAEELEMFRKALEKPVLEWIDNKCVEVEE